MKTLARITAVIFMLLGFLIILGGIGFAVYGIMNQTSSTTPVSGLLPDMSGLVVAARIAGGSVIGLQGLFLAAIGQVIWLLAGIFEQTHKTSEALSSMLLRTSQTKQ